jgi:hypothetical protein
MLKNQKQSISIIIYERMSFFSWFPLNFSYFIILLNITSYWCWYFNFKFWFQLFLVHFHYFICIFCIYVFHCQIIIISICKYI